MLSGKSKEKTLQYVFNFVLRKVEEEFFLMNSEGNKIIITIRNPVFAVLISTASSCVCLEAETQAMRKKIKLISFRSQKLKH